MRIDLSRVAAAAVEAALDDGSSKPQRRLTMPKAIAAGAALALAARYAVTKAPDLPHVPDLSALRDRLPDGLHEKLADRGWLGADEDWDDEELEDEEFEDEPED